MVELGDETAAGHEAASVGKVLRRWQYPTTLDGSLALL
jgi:hypothetical protein